MGAAWGLAAILLFACSSSSVHSVPGSGGAAGQAGSSAGSGGQAGGSAGQTGGNGGTAGTAPACTGCGASSCECIPSAPDPWIPIAISSDLSASCPEGYGTPLTGGLGAKDDGCSCSCGALTGAACHAVLEYWSQQASPPSCPTTGIAEKDLTADQSHCDSNSLHTSGRIKSVVSAPGTCTPQAAPAPAVFDNARKICQLASKAACSGGDICVPTAPAPFSGACIMYGTPGTDASCPGDYQTKIEFFSKLADTRACSATGCTCSPQTTCAGAMAHRCANNSQCNLSSCSDLAMPEGQCVDIKGKAVKLDSSGAPERALLRGRGGLQDRVPGRGHRQPPGRLLQVILGRFAGAGPFQERNRAPDCRLIGRLGPACRFWRT